MLKDLYTGVIPSDLDYSNMDGHEWDILLRLWVQRYSSPSFSYFEDANGPQWLLCEEVGGYGFRMRRNRISQARFTDVDDLGLVGLSMVNPQDDRVIITEGVSDYMTAKLLCPGCNVVGFTTLCGSVVAKRIIGSLFRKIIYCCDADATGRGAGRRIKEYFGGLGCVVSLFEPPSGFKDITEAFLFNIRLSIAGC